PNATISSSTVTISGFARDNIEVASVTVSLNGGAPFATTLSAPGALGVPWTITPNLAQGLHGGLNSAQVVSKDTAGNSSASVTRSFTFVEKGSLTVITKVGGTITSVGGTVPGVSTAPNFYQVGKIYAFTAKPTAGYVFDHWAIPGIDSSSPATQVPALSLLYSDAIFASPTITAVFAATPYTAAKIGAFNGLVTAHQGSIPSNSTTGFVTVNVTSAGTFTGTLKTDGMTLSIGGLFDLTGTARFGATRSDKVLVARTNKPAVELMLHLDLAGTTVQVTGTVKQYLRTTLVSTSDVLADRAAFDAKLNPFSTAHASYLVNKGLYTVVLPAKAQGNGLTSADFPQGSGFGTITLTAAGSASFSGTLADGTVVTASAPISKNLTIPLFAQLYALKAGSFSGLVTLDDTQADSDLKAVNCAWFRPWSNNQYYPWGWDEGVSVNLFGAKYQSTSLATNVLLGATNLPSPNTLLTFTEGSLASTVTKQVNVSATNAVTKFDTTDKSFGLTLVASTAKITGTFPHTSGTTSAFQGIVYQKGNNTTDVQLGGNGYFLTLAPKVINGEGTSGKVTVKPNVVVP
ncbi:MAG: hypothetical protein JWO08_1743, partial [Verrucomicrobiaceae bacterium]|nr:hypothetical protein [Verrucomicrobiaceae bacterium]